MTTTDFPAAETSRSLPSFFGRARELAKQSNLLRTSFRAAREELFSKRTAELRRGLIGELTYRRLGPTDERTVLVFAKNRIFMPSAFLINGLHHRWLDLGMAVGAFDKRGKLRGFACLDTYDFDGIGVEGWWIRSITVDRMARNFGVAQRMVSLLLDHASTRRLSRVRAAIAPTNDSSLAVFERSGFRPVYAEERARIVEQWKRSGPTEDWCVYERVLRTPTLRTLYAARPSPKRPPAYVSGERWRR